MRMRKSITSYNTKRNTVVARKPTEPDGSKSTGRKVSYVAVFTDTTRRRALPEEVSIHTAEMTAIKIATNIQKY